ncbi:hypothetical protein MJO28_012068 [Puccinia striiformis f. sp. tritici]|uniref:Uncharacterized protein n=1 Tax=Puccinia striiformis f. sp. tritici TaxID=168172 RepID=A0ACC0E030_9BASI|nr:hypothetical protein MJO28_012068 [Puccinia striiformis f. sp. tritici]
MTIFEQRPVRPVSLPGDRSEGVMFEAERIDNYDGDLERCSIGLVSLSGEQSKGGSRSTERVDVNGDGLERCPVGLVSLFGKQSKGAVFKAEVYYEYVLGLGDSARPQCSRRSLGNRTS